MTKRILVLLALVFAASPASAQFTRFGPKLTPAEAAAILARSPGLSNVANWPAPMPEGPTVVIIGSRPGASSWLDFPAPSPRYRLDGSPAWRPPVIYGGRPPYGSTFLTGRGPFLSTPHEANGPRNRR